MMKMPVTTFEKLKKQGACEEGYRKLAKALGGISSFGKDEPITLIQILDSNGLDDAIWALRACDDCDRFARELVCDFADECLPIFEKQAPKDNRPRKAIEVARRYARGEATQEELGAAMAAARDAAWKAALAARAAAWTAAWAAEWKAALAARAAARDAAWAAERDAARAAWGAARAKQEKILRDKLRMCE
jgi:hypothetical protein